MATPLLISKSDFAGRVDISANLDASKKLNQHILHAQDFDLRELMGDKLYWDMINNYNISTADPKVFTAPYLDLFNGVVYTNDGIPVGYEGLKPVIVYFAAARLIKGLDTHITPNAIMAKRNDFSDPVELKTKVFEATQYENAAISYWNMSKKYLDVNHSLFTYWNYDCGCVNESNFRPRMTAVGHSPEYYNRGYGIRRR